MKNARKIYGAVSTLLLAAFIIGGTIFFWQFFTRFQGDPDLLKNYLAAFGKWPSMLIFIGLQMIQIIFPIIPGEIIEVGAGYVFGMLKGFILCEIGIVLASIPIFFAVRTFGNRVLYFFFGFNKFKALNFLQNEKKLSLVVFFLFFVPGTPKDLLTYFVGLTPIKTAHFLFIVVFARIPSIVTSTLIGANLGSKNQTTSIVVYAIFGFLSAVGLLGYNKYTKTKAAKRKSRGNLSPE